MKSLDRITEYLNGHQIPFEIIAHPRTASSRQAAHAAGVDSHRLVKAVLLEAPECYLAAMIPADEQVRLGMRSRDYGRQFHLAPEETVRRVFDGCDAGAAPGLPIVWDVDMIWDDDLLVQPDGYMEDGDHERLIHVQTKDLAGLLQDTPHCHFARPHTRHRPVTTKRHDAGSVGSRR